MADEICKALLEHSDWFENGGGLPLSMVRRWIEQVPAPHGQTILRICSLLAVCAEQAKVEQAIKVLEHTNIVLGMPIPCPRIALWKARQIG